MWDGYQEFGHDFLYNNFSIHFVCINNFINSTFLKFHWTVGVLHIEGEKKKLKLVITTDNIFISNYAERAFEV